MNNNITERNKILQTGWMLSIFSLAFVVGSKYIGPPLLETVGAKNIMHIGFAIGVGVLFGLAQTTKTTGLVALAIEFFLVGIVITLVNLPSILLATEYVHTDKSGIASGILFTVRWLGGSIYIAIITLIYGAGLAVTCYTLSAVALAGLLFSLTLRTRT